MGVNLERVESEEEKQILMPHEDKLERWSLHISAIES